jgi:hypothetical protein
MSYKEEDTSYGTDFYRVSARLRAIAVINEEEDTCYGTDVFSSSYID